MQISNHKSPVLAVTLLILMEWQLAFISGAELPSMRSLDNMKRSKRAASDDNSIQYHNNTINKQQEMEAEYGNSAAQLTSFPASSSTRELHFGAKISLSLLMAVILLVASATFVDLKSSATCCTSTEWKMESTHLLQQRQPLQHFQQQILHMNHDDKQQRDQRSPSLSSSNSSTLFSSANSVSSASAPILGANRSSANISRDTNNAGHSRRNLIRQVGSCFACGRKSRTTNYNNNLQFSNEAQAGAIAASHHKQQQQERSLEVAVLKVEPQWRRHQSSGSFEQQPQLEDKSHSASRQLARQVFLSFSLRHSASLIFETSDEIKAQQAKVSQVEHRASRCPANQPSPLLGSQQAATRPCFGCHRSRLSSLSSINETNIQNDSEADRNSSSSLDLDGCFTFHLQDNTGDQGYQAGSRQPQTPHDAPRLESIDSLHGLRFLSMIWIIVIHSYSFALRWLFFTNSSTLNDIYKTAASQLLANGTFACDSFFFAGGFLLPYLAFPAYKAPESPARLSTVGFTSHSTAACNNSTELAEQCKQDNSASSCNHHQKVTARSVSPERIPSFQELDSLSSNGRLDSRQSAAATAASTRATCHPAAPHSTTQQHNHLQSLDDQNIASATYWHQHQQQQQQQQQKSSRNPQNEHLNTNEKFTLKQVIRNILHRYIRMMPLMMAIIGLSATLLRYLGEGPAWNDSTIMFDKWCRNNWWINALFLHNFIKRENMCLGHSWYSAVDIQLFLIGQLILFILFRSKFLGILLCCTFLIGAQLITGALTLIHHLPAVPLIASVSEQSMNLYYGEIYIKPYCRASPYLIGILLAYLMRTTSLGQVRLNKWQVATGWTASIGTLVTILMAMQPAMNGQVPSELQSALYSSLSRPLWACATGWMIFACMTKHGGIFASILSARCFVPLSRLTYPAFLIHPIIMAVFYGSRQSSFHFSHYLMLYLILGNIVITYAIAFILAALFELPLLSVERAIKRAWSNQKQQQQQQQQKKQPQCKKATATG